jgi:hypothetical protein
LIVTGLNVRDTHLRTSNARREGLSPHFDEVPELEGLQICNSRCWWC